MAENTGLAMNELERTPTSFKSGVRCAAQTKHVRENRDSHG